MSVSVHDVLNDPSSTALDERDGRYIAPQAIEVEFKAVCPIASAMLVHADVLNGRLNPGETIEEFRILDHDLSVDDDELTPSLKVRRKVIESRYRALLDPMYAGQRRG